MVQLTLPMSTLASQTHKAGGLRCKEAVKEALRRALANCGLSREVVADELSRLTGEAVSVHAVNNWAAPGKGDRSIPLDQLAALTVITGDPGPARAALECAGLAVLMPEQTPLYELGRITAEDRERAKQRKALWDQINR
ncbi:MAG: hypothetical protein KUA35_10310 [Pseudodesulfovibrio sp.]|nr:hypothetical protein [Pseudodesulfovibrio aespoeensis]MBU4243471.1 hypothetical protein [Pseudomonadota bacterium]MBV1772803.1 hypothetical protein [Pseudodesulfovibrio sp.]MBU4380034.1 hypothetical protein [Pseudomonadota bacterium]MBU4473805.1 hypothetical protein [Pseudomonadota bacterium]MBU4520929.1 hypothetical protein [Pseudomonadota bacterium]